MSAAAQLPRYKSHKVVWALKIANITETQDGGAVITPVEIGYASFKVDAAYMKKHQPETGGYYVVYPPDGYKSWSPAEAFESGYTREP